MAASGFASGFVTGFITTGNLKGALKEGFLGAIGAVASFGIGHSAFGKSLGRLKHAAHGVTRGAMGSLRGGSFKSGFLSGLVGSIAGGFIEGAKFLQKAGPFAQYAATTIAGGAASAAGGGKFANGAISAAFVYIFNHYSEDPKKPYGVKGPYKGKLTLKDRFFKFMYKLRKVIYGQASKAALGINLISPIGALISGLTYSEELNKGEDEWLRNHYANRRKQEQLNAD